MDFVYQLVYVITIVILPILMFFLFFKKRGMNVSTGNDRLHLPKFYLAKRFVQKQQDRYKKRLKKIGDKLETEIQISDYKTTDSQCFSGVDHNGNFIYFKIEIGIGQIAEASLHLRFADGNIYTFPTKNGTIQTNLLKNIWKIAGFNIEVLEPYKKLRITFNGLLKNVSHSDLEKIEHVQFNFIFTCYGSPHFIPQDIHSDLYARALANEYWRDGSWMDNIVDQYGFVHFGAMKGFIKGDSYPEPNIINFVTCRSRCKGINDRFILKKMIRIFACDEYGNVFKITAKSFINNCKQLNYGFAYLSNEKRHPISEIDIQYNAEEDRHFPNYFKINIVVNNVIYNITLNLQNNKILNSTINNKYGYDFYTIPAACKINTFNGSGLMEFWYKKSDDEGLYIPNKKIKLPVIALPDNFITDLNDKESQILDLTGGKGTSLALLTSLESNSFTVPEGFIITTNAYKHHLLQNETLSKSILLLNDICCGKIQGNIEESCKQVVSMFKNGTITEKLRNLVIDQLSKYKEKEEYFGWAVRSSAIGEDSEELSAAGQNDTFLGCQREEDVLTAILACWASLYTNQSVQYRWQHGLAVITDMSVVVQRMLKSESAGVLFTCHPSTMNPSEMVITSNFGLGETVVSGESDPDTIVLKRTWDDEISVKEKLLGSKNKILTVTSDNLKEINIEESSQDNWSISEEQAVALGKVGALLESIFGGPQDLEWAFYRNKLYLLQSRAITTLNTWTDFELSHEMDTPSRMKHIIYTTANVKEVIPKAVTALSYSTTMLCTDYAMQKFAQNNFDPLSSKGLVIHQHNILVDVIISFYKNIQPKLHISTHIVDLAVFGHPVMTESIHKIAMNRMGLTHQITQLLESIRVMKNIWGKIVEKSVYRVNNMELNWDENDTLISFYTKIDTSINDAIDVSVYHSMTSAISVFFQIIAMNILLEGNSELTNEHISDFGLILSSCEDVVSAEVPKYLENIAKIIKESDLAEEFAKIIPTEGIEWLKNNCSKAYNLLSEFLDKHGHRSFGEFEIMDKSWKEDPSVIITMIQANLHTEKRNKNILSIDDVINNLKSPKKNLTKLVIKFLIKKIRVSVGRREQTKSEMVRAYDKLRQAYRILGEQMVLNGLLPSKDLINHLTHKEIGSVIQKRSPDLVTKAVRRQKLYPKWQKLRFPELMEGEAKPIEEIQDHVRLSGVCKGTPVCAGIVQARACVIQSLDQIDQLQTGDILITYSTDIGWSPYFPMLGGIVTELGGLISHGAVVAREYGLPCIVGVQNPNRYFKTGDIIQINGNSGEIGLI